MNTENLSTLNIHKLTQAQYDRELAAGNIDENALYLTPYEEIDLSPYATIEQLNSRAAKEHAHAIADVSGLQSALNQKSDSDHTHTASDVGALSVSGGTVNGDLTVNGTITGTTVKGAVWNDYAEYREADVTEPGRVVCENGDDTLSLSTTRLQPGANVISDTFGFSIGETEYAKTPIAVSGRVLAYPYEDRCSYKPGDAVCAAPNGTVSKMTREEIREYPDRIIGTVSAVPNYATWGTDNISVNGRIWIKIK